MEQKLLPAWSLVTLAEFWRVLLISWPSEEPINYGDALLSYAMWDGARDDAYRAPEGAYLFGDSGGFTLMSQGTQMQIDPVGVLKWQIARCSAGCILDLPPRGGSAPKSVNAKNFKGTNQPMCPSGNQQSKPRRIWDDPLEDTIEHTKRALPTYVKAREAGEKFRWWGVLHGNRFDEQQEYWRAVSAVYPFTDDGEGWAIRAEPEVNITHVARSLRSLQKFGIKRAHFLAATGIEVMATIMALGPEAGLEFVTYDSTSAIKLGANRGMFEPKDLGWEIVVEDGEERHVFDALLEKCQCLVCTWIRAKDTPRIKKTRERKTWGGSLGIWAALHNFHVQERAVARMWKCAQADPDKFLREMLGADYFRIRRVFEGIEPEAIVRTGTERSLLDFS